LSIRPSLGWLRVAPELLPVPILLAALLVLCVVETNSPAHFETSGMIGPNLSGRQAAMVLITVAVQLLVAASAVFAVATFLQSRSGIRRAIGLVAAYTALVVVVEVFWPDRSSYESGDYIAPPLFLIDQTEF
jgi:hypothetical protein